MIKQISIQELKEIYRKNINAVCKKYGNDVKHYCFVPILIKTKTSNYLTINWFINGNNELIIKPSKNIFMPLVNKNDKQVYIYGNSLKSIDEVEKSNGMLGIYLLDVPIKNISGRLI